MGHPARAEDEAGWFGAGQRGGDELEGGLAGAQDLYGFATVDGGGDVVEWEKAYWALT